MKTEDAAEVAPGEEDRPRAVPPPEAVLLTEVGEVARHARVAAGLADRGLPLEPVDPAVPRAGDAGGEAGDRFFGPPAELAERKAAVCRPCSLRLGGHASTPLVGGRPRSLSEYALRTG